MKRTWKMNSGVVVAACSCALLLLPGVLMAEEEEGFQLEIDPIVLSALSTDVDGDSSKFGEYADYSSGFMIPKLNIRGWDSDSDRYLSIYGTDIWRDQARMALEYGVTGRYDLYVDYNKIPHLFGNNGTMLWGQTDRGRMQFPDSSQAQLQAAILAAPSRNFDLLEELLTPYIDAANSIDFKLQRNKLFGRLDLNSMNKLAWAIEYGHEKRSGNREFGGSFGFNNAQEIIEPIAYDTTDAALMGEWTGESSGLQFGYRYSMFENSVDTMIWDNPFRAVDSTDPIAYLGPTTTPNGPSTGIIDLAPDNEASSLFAGWRSKFGGSWWAKANASYSNMEQNDLFQAYTPNTAITGIRWPGGGTFDPTDPSTLPAARGDLSVDVLSVNADLGADLGENFEFELSYRYYDYDNTSTRLEFDGYVRMHAVWEEVPRINVPYSYTKQDIGAELAWEGSRNSRVALEYVLREWDRTFRETDNTDEDIIRLTWDQKFSPRFDLRASYDYGDRTHNDYRTEAQEESFLDPHGINNQPGLRKFLQANRERNAYRVDFNFYPSDTTQLMFGIDGMDDDYPDSEFGLQAYEQTRYNAEFSYAPGESLNFFIFGNTSDGESTQRSRQSGATLSEDPNNDWQLILSEDQDVYGLGLNAHLGSRWTAELLGQWAEADGAGAFFTSPAGSPDEFFDIDNYDDTELFFVKLRFVVEVTEGAKIGLGYWYEDYTLDTFLQEGRAPYVGGAIMFDPNNGDYTANVFSLDLSISL